MIILPTKYKIWDDNKYKKEYIKQNFSDNDRDDFNYEIDKTKEYKDAQKKEKDIYWSRELEYKKKEKLDKIKQTIIDEKEKENKDTKKLKVRIAKNQLFTQYGRNQDRFMEFAVRYLAESNYFGKDAKFELYKHYSTKEQEDDLKILKKELTKKKFDKLKFHQGQLVHFSTFKEHLTKYGSWDMPFVIENNSIKVKIEFEYKDTEETITKTVYINRKVIIYLLEHALYKHKTENIGKILLANYYKYGYLKEFDAKKAILENQDTITSEEKKEFRKLFPRRLLHHYREAEERENNEDEY